MAKKTYQITFPDGTQDITRTTTRNYQWALIVLVKTSVKFFDNPGNGENYWHLGANSCTIDGIKRAQKSWNSDDFVVETRIIPMEYLD